jgi:hypothetical protein
MRPEVSENPVSPLLKLHVLNRQSTELCAIREADAVRVLEKTGIRSKLLRCYRGHVL